jgi:hypothetical protein
MSITQDKCSRADSTRYVAVHACTFPGKPTTVIHGKANKQNITVKVCVINSFFFETEYGMYQVRVHIVFKT